MSTATQTKTAFFQLETQLHSGIGASAVLIDILANEAVQSPLIIVDEGVKAHSSYFAQFFESIQSKYPGLHLIETQGQFEPTYDYLDEVLATARSYTVDFVIGIGGGSCLDITKAVAALLTNPGNPRDYRGFDKLSRPAVPCAAIPTTAGTGSEVTINASFVDTDTKFKMGVNGRYMNARYAILDAKWLESCPRSVEVSAGIDALVHAVEGYICNKANVVTQYYSKEGVRILMDNLNCIVEDPKNLEKKQSLLLGSYVAAIGMFNSGSGLAAVLSYPTGVHYLVPHGICGGIFLASAIDFNIQRGYTQGYAELFDAIEPRNNASTQEEKAKGFLKRIQDLSDLLEIPKTLNHWGIHSANVADLAKEMIPMQGGFDQNPVPFDAEKDSLEILKKHVD